MATNHTTNYALNLWEANDKFVREEFNENTSKIDTALKTHDSAVAAIQTTLSGMVKLAVGHYTGDGAATRTISVGFTPKAVLVINANGQTHSSNAFNSYVYGGLAVDGGPMTSANEQSPLQIVSGGFQVSCQLKNDTWNATNYTGYPFNYIALG